MNNFLKGMLLGEVSICLATVIYKKGVYKGYKQGSEVGKLLGKIEAYSKILNKSEESKSDEETE